MHDLPPLTQVVLTRQGSRALPTAKLSGVAEKIGDEYLFRTVETAVAAFERRATVRGQIYQESRGKIPTPPDTFR